MLTKTVDIIVVEKVKKVFEDGAYGYYLTGVDEKGKLINFWCSGEYGDMIDAYDAEGWNPSIAKRFVLRRKLWDGKEKLSVVNVL